jgi:HlyD family secretion protein
MVVSDLSSMLVEAEVDETDTVHLAPGQQASITLDSIPKLTLSGRVEEIATSAHRQQGISLFRIKVLLEELDSRLRPGMSADLEIQTDTATGALYVPLQAVQERKETDLGRQEKRKRREKRDDDDSFEDRQRGEEEAEYVTVVFRAVDDRAKHAVVETGISDDYYVEVLSGLDEGDIIIDGPYRILRQLNGGEKIRIKSEKSELQKKGVRNLGGNRASHD